MLQGFERQPIGFEAPGFLARETEGKFLTYGQLSHALEDALEIYSSYEGVRFLLDKRAEAITKIMVASGNKIKGIFSTGYPNYVIPEIDMPSPATALTKDQFVPVPEILGYVQNTLNRAKSHNPEETWPCPTCYSSLGLQSLRPTGHKCTSPVEPFYLYTSLPDSDLYIIIENTDDIPEIVKAYEDAGLGVAENRMLKSVIGFPGIINIDPQFITIDDLTEGLQRAISEPDTWYRVKVPAIKHHGVLAMGEIHLGLDLASQLTPQIVQDPELMRMFIRARHKFAMNASLEKIVAQMVSAENCPELQPMIARLIANYPDIRKRFIARVKAYRESGIEASGPDSDYIIVSNPHSDAISEVYEEISTREYPVYVIDESLLPFLGEYSPSFVADLNRTIGCEYPYNSDNLTTEKAAHLTMAHNGLDNILFEGNATPALLDDRLHRLAGVMEYMGLSTEELENYLQESGNQMHTFAETTYYAKWLAFQLYQYFARTPDETRTLSASPNEYPFVNTLRELFGDRLQNIILYGSSTNLRIGNDYDLLVIVDDISEQLYMDLENKQQKINSLCNRPVEMIIIPKKDLPAYLSAMGMPFGTIELVHGQQIDIPVFPADMTFHTAHKIARSLASMQMAFRDPEYYVKKPQVLRAHLKLPNYLIESYRSLYGNLLPLDFFDQLHEEFQMPATEDNLTPERVKVLRSKTMHNLFTISKRVIQEVATIQSSL